MDSIQFVQPDLTISVGEGEGKRVYTYHSVSLALQSTYIDTMLSSPMREGNTKSISFPDIEPDIWDRMMECVLPGYLSLPTKDEAMKLVPYCHKYDFHVGLKICDHVVAKFIESYVLDSVPDETDDVVAAFVHSHNLGLEKATAAGIQDIGKRLIRNFEEGERTYLTVGALTELAPVYWPKSMFCGHPSSPCLETKCPRGPVMRLRPKGAFPCCSLTESSFARNAATLWMTYEMS